MTQYNEIFLKSFKPVRYCKCTPNEVAVVANSLSLAHKSIQELKQLRDEVVDFYKNLVNSAAPRSPQYFKVLLLSGTIIPIIDNTIWARPNV